MEAAPQTLNYSRRPLTVASESKRRLFLPSTGANTIAPGGRVEFDLRAAPNEFIDMRRSYMTIDITNNSTNRVLCPDIGRPFLQRLETRSGGTSIDDIEHYGKYDAFHSFGTKTPTQIRNQGSMSGGASDDLNRKISWNTTGTEGTTVLIPRTTTAPTFTDPANALSGSISATNTRQYCFPLLGAIFNQKHLLPLGLMSGGLQVALTFADAAAIGVANDAVGNAPTLPDWSATVVGFHAHVVRLNSEFTQMLRETQLTAGLCLYGHSVRCHVNNVQTGDSTKVFKIPNGQPHLRSIISIPSFTTGTTANTFFSTSVGKRAGITSYIYRVGAQNYPENRVRVGARRCGQAYQEVSKVWGYDIADAQDASFSTRTYQQDVATAGTMPAITTAQYVGSAKGEPLICQNFHIGVAFDSFENMLNDGVSTSNGEQVELELECNYPNNGLLHHYLGYDVVLKLDGSGILNVNPRDSYN